MCTGKRPPSAAASRARAARDADDGLDDRTHSKILKLLRSVLKSHVLVRFAMICLELSE